MDGMQKSIRVISKDVKFSDSGQVPVGVRISVEKAELLELPVMQGDLERGEKLGLTEKKIGRRRRRENEENRVETAFLRHVSLTGYCPVSLSPCSWELETTSKCFCCASLGRVDSHVQQ